MAQCSESTGTSSAPGTWRRGCTTGAAAIRLSLLARARRLPACRVAMVTGSPANPTTPFTTTSATAASSARSPDHLGEGQGVGHLGPPGGVGHRHDLGPQLAGLGDHDVGGRPDPERRPPRSGRARPRMTSRVWVPIDPDEPAMATLITRVESYPTSSTMLR